MLALISCVLLAQADIRVTYNEVRDLTAEHYGINDVYRQERNELDISLTFGVVYKGRSRPATVDSDKVFFTIHSSSESWEFLNYHSAVAMLDGKRRPLKETDVDREVEKGFVMEHFRYQFTMADLKEWADAREVKISIGGTTFALDTKAIDAIHEAYERLAASTDELKAREAKLAKQQADDVERQAAQVAEFQRRTAPAREDLAKLIEKCRREQRNVHKSLYFTAGWKRMLAYYDKEMPALVKKHNLSQQDVEELLTDYPEFKTRKPQ